MLAILEQLLVIQDRDRRLAQLKAEQARIPLETKAVDRRIQDESARLETVRQEMRRVEGDRKKLEIDADTKRAQIAKYQSQLAQVKANTEYQALLKEIKKAEEEIKSIEDVELEIMDKSEHLQPALKQEQALLKELTDKAEGERAELRKRADMVEQELEQVVADRQSLAAQADPDALARYERLLRSKGDYAIVPVRNGNCGGCHLHLAPQLVHQAKSGTGLVSCDYCGRVLYWSE